MFFILFPNNRIEVSKALTIVETINANLETAASDRNLAVQVRAEVIQYEAEIRQISDEVWHNVLPPVHLTHDYEVATIYWGVHSSQLVESYYKYCTQ